MPAHRQRTAALAASAAVLALVHGAARAGADPLPPATAGGVDAVTSSTPPPLRVNPDLVTALSTLGPIPKKLHIIFPDKGVVDHKDEMVDLGVRQMIDMNPDWTWKVYDHDAVDAYLRAELGRDEPLLSKEDIDLVLRAHIVERTDAVRLLIMYHEGGFYQDVDRVYNVPMSEVLTPQTKMVIPTLYDTNFMQDVMCTAPRNPVVLHAIHVAWKIRRRVTRVDGWANFWDHMEMVNSWSRSIMESLFGISKTGLPRKQFDEARRAINAVPWLKTYREEWCDGPWVRPFEGCKAVSRAALYEFYKITPWKAETNAKWTVHCKKLRSKAGSVAQSELEAQLVQYNCSHPDHGSLHGGFYPLAKPDAAAGGATAKVTSISPEVNASLTKSCGNFRVRVGDVKNARWVPKQAAHGYKAGPVACCGMCKASPRCSVWVVMPSTQRCWLMEPVSDLASVQQFTAQDRISGVLVPGDSGSDNILSISSSLVAKLEALQPIPRKIHVFYPKADIATSDSAVAAMGVKSMASLNPGWELTVWDSGAVSAYLHREPERPDPLLTRGDVKLLRKAHYIERAIMARLLVLWREGGFTQDAHLPYNVPMATALADDGVKMVLPVSREAGFSTGVICTSADNPVVRRAVELAEDITRRATRARGWASRDAVAALSRVWAEAVSIEVFGATAGEVDPVAASALLASRNVAVIDSPLDQKCSGRWVQPFAGCEALSGAGALRRLNQDLGVTPWEQEVSSHWASVCQMLVGIRGKLRGAQKRPAALDRVESDIGRFGCDS